MAHLAFPIMVGPVGDLLPDALVVMPLGDHLTGVVAERAGCVVLQVAMQRPGPLGSRRNYMADSRKMIREKLESGAELARLFS